MDRCDFSTRKQVALLTMSGPISFIAQYIHFEKIIQSYVHYDTHNTELPAYTLLREYLTESGTFHKIIHLYTKL